MNHARALRREMMNLPYGFKKHGGGYFIHRMVPGISGKRADQAPGCAHSLRPYNFGRGVGRRHNYRRERVLVFCSPVRNRR